MYLSVSYYFLFLLTVKNRVELGSERGRWERRFGFFIEL